MSRPDKDQPSTLGFGRDWVWRVPFLLSVVMVAIGLWIRLGITESAIRIAKFHEVPKNRPTLFS